MLEVLLRDGIVGSGPLLLLSSDMASFSPSQAMPHDGIIPRNLQATCFEAALLRRKAAPGSRCVTRRLLPKLGWHLPRTHRLPGSLVEGKISETETGQGWS